MTNTIHNNTIRHTLLHHTPHAITPYTLHITLKRNLITKKKLNNYLFILKKRILITTL